MKVISTALPDVFIFEPSVYPDARGFFMECFNQKFFSEATGFQGNFVQDNHSRSAKNVLRGMHYQLQKPQGKLLRVTNGTIFDVVVDVRKSAPTFGQWLGVELSSDNRYMLWVPPGYAHGFVALTDDADVTYKVTDYHFPQGERSIAWNDRAIGIKWPVQNPILSERDQKAARLKDAEVYN
jgi:dTDP-4-dehydrorhamnose 3,5-epimerase